MKFRHMILVGGLSVVVAHVTSISLFQGRFSTPCRADGCVPPKGAPEDLAYCNGDANGDHNLDLSDAVYLLSYLFLGGPEPVAYAACTHTPQECDDLEFGRSIAGSYVCRNAEGNPRSLAFGADGILVAASGDEGWTAYGTWRRTGPREATAVTLSFMEVEGEIAYTIVRTYVSHFSEDCSTQTLDLHLVGYDFPADPTEAAFPPGTPLRFEQDYQFVATKIQ